jgi:hypothetical protein
VPARRAHVRRAERHITPEAAAAFLAGDGLALRRALGLKPWEFTISPTEDQAEEEGWSVEKLMAHREQIETELNDWERN